MKITCAFPSLSLHARLESTRLQSFARGESSDEKFQAKNVPLREREAR